MSDPGHGEGDSRRRPLPEVIRYWGVAVLAAGLVAAVLIYVFAGEGADSEAAREIASERMYQHNLELMGGKLNVLLVEFNDWFASLWHGTSLALTVAVLSIAIALGCFWIAHLIATTPDHSDTNSSAGHSR